MNTIADFSDEPKYTIKNVCEQTGIQAVTLRAWERRHEILSPFRSDNRYRLYSERDIALLRWIKKRLDDGISISSAVTELRGMQKRGISPEAVPTLAPLEPQQEPRMSPAEFSQALYRVLIQHDEGSAAKLVDEMQASFTLKTVLFEIYTPCLVEIGEAWYRGQIRVATEHFASNFIKGKLFAIYQNLPSRRTAPLLLIGCAPTEQHEIGTLMLSILERIEGNRVEYLGPDIPLDDLADYAKYEKPKLIILSASMESSALEMARFQDKLAKIRPTPIFGYGGRAFVLKPQLIQRIPGIYLGNTIEESLTAIRSLLERKK